MDRLTIEKRLAIIKYLYLLGRDTLLKGSSLSKANCVLHFHDAIESFFILVCDLTGANRKNNLNFMDYFEEIKKADVGKGNRELTHKGPLDRLNSIRSSFKHKGILPNEQECESLRVSLEDFFEENVPKFCNVDFGRIAFSNSIENQEAKTLIQSAEQSFENKDYEECLSKLGEAFEILRDEAWKKTKAILDGSAVFLQPKLNLFATSLDELLGSDGERFLNSFYEPLADAINVLILGLDYKKYVKFRCLTPRFYKLAGGALKQTSRPRDFDTRFNITKENTEFCYLFVVESALQMESFEFGLVNARDKPDKVTVIDEEEISYFGEDLKEKGKVRRGQIIKFLGSCRHPPDNPKLELIQITYEGKNVWIPISARTKQIDNP